MQVKAFLANGFSQMAALNISDWSLKSRFIAAFMIPASLILVSGAASDYFLRAVLTETKNVTDIASPIFH